jgi:hypothetical protein
MLSSFKVFLYHNVEKFSLIIFPHMMQIFLGIFLHSLVELFHENFNKVKKYFKVRHKTVNIFPHNKLIQESD